MKIEYASDISVIILQPEGPLTEQDFREAAARIDPIIEASGMLKGIIIRTESFPGWHSFSALLEHLRFVNDHHHLIRRVALVTDSSVVSLAEHVAAHFISAEIKAFAYPELEQARAWTGRPD
ncbi:STAS/SEC14 domain-containing protein [Neptuniibacter halophilus]|uniref:STAS/SEC14 domain-containing protein n=1 Tax=Neptuniibacter halophilus TaxID=651666 RepID=UPI0025732338|nr:STAS/SEC14 domain-containing protein [Neptuniibacter halophilus]